jgi:hypothetical protein
MVVNTCNPSYLEGRGRRLLSSKSAQAKLARFYLKNQIKTKGLRA